MVDAPVHTMQVAPTILKAISVAPNALQAVKLEKTSCMLGAGFSCDQSRSSRVFKAESSLLLGFKYFWTLVLEH